MPLVVYVTPNFTSNTVRFIESLIGFHDIRVIVISQESVSLLPAWQQSRIMASYKAADIFNAGELIRIVTDIEIQWGKVHRLFGANEPLQVPLAEVRKAFGIEGMSVETAWNFRDKARMKKLFEKNNVPCARHRIVKTLEDAISFTRLCPYPFVLKPLAGAGSQTTFRIENEPGLKAAFEKIGPGAGEYIIEEFIRGKEYSLDSFSVDGKIVSQTINEYFPAPLEVMENPWIQWRVILKKESASDDAFEDIREKGRHALEILGMKNGMSHMEWFRKANGEIAISEVAARPPGAQFMTLISRACDFDAVKAWMHLMVYGATEIPEVRYSCGAAYLRGVGHGKIKDVSGMETIRSKYNDIITDIRLPKTGQEKFSGYEGDGYIILRHPDSIIIENALADIVNTVRISYDN